jgi:predicted nucleic acid-binding protein
MSGIKYLLDTNYILAILKSEPVVLAEVAQRGLSISACAYSAITRMELLGFHGMSGHEEAIILGKLARLTYLPLTQAIEDVAIALRRTRKIKLPDSVIAATAICAELELLTLDKHLLAVTQTYDPQPLTAR